MDNAKKEAGEQQQSQPATVNWEFVQPKDGTAFIYGNHIVLDWTITDLHVRVGDLSVNPLYRTTPNQKTLRIEERACVTLTWGTAKYLMGELQIAIDKYEELNGEIKVPILP